MYFLGITAYGHDSAVALLDGAHILSFVEEERFNRQKHTTVFPERALRYVLEQHGLDLADIDEIAFFLKPWQLIACRTARALRYLPRSLVQFTTYRPGNAMKILALGPYLRHNSFAPRRPARFRLRYLEHHLAHAASVYYLSGFDEAAILSIDGAGEDITTWFGRGHGARIERRHCVRLPHSLGLFYSAVTDYLGFKPWGGEGKVMGLAPYGDPERYDRQMRDVLRWTEDGQFHIDLRYFDYHVTGWTRWVSPAFEQAFGPRRQPESELTRRSEDIAAALQRVVEEAALALVRYLHRLVPSRNLCLAGGVALNSVLNGRIRREGPFENIFIQPAANDAGTALGGALFLACGAHGLPRDDGAEIVYLGPEYSAAACAAAAAASGLVIERPDDIAARTAELLAAGKIVGWFQGRMEIGPRALGNRSILADPRDPTAKDTLNRRVKHREPFRPFAPSVLAEAASDYFDGIDASPHMLLVFPVRPERRACVPAITHVDGTARVQTVTRNANPLYYRLIEAFGRRTGVPMLLNTSFNVRGEPIVCTPEDAIACFRGTQMDYLALGDLLLSKP
ncbi:MAG TPA: carbamoyltransferase [Candidatus Acidoferrales bacterium]|nr:carbamoyltransferase [Candidatus Acidoferrales bacterium]